jgi:hypothetical protein
MEYFRKVLRQNFIHISLDNTMALSFAQLKKYRSRFAWVFAISFIVLLISTLSLPTESILGHFPPRIHPGRTHPPPRALLQAEPINLAMLISVASLLTSATSLVGFFFTTAIAWRKKQREQQHGDLDLDDVG